MEGETQNQPLKVLGIFDSAQGSSMGEPHPQPNQVCIISLAYPLIRRRLRAGESVHWDKGLSHKHEDWGWIPQNPH